MDKVIFIINGVAQSGKDSVVTLAKDYLYHKKIKVNNFSSIEPIKEIAKFLGWNGIDKDEKTRKFLSDIKQLSINYNDFPFKYICKCINEANNKSVNFIHCREINEIKKIYNYFKNTLYIKTILVKRKVKIPNNHSDLNVNNFKYDIVINNNGDFDELKKKTEMVIFQQIWRIFK